MRGTLLRGSTSVGTGNGTLEEALKLQKPQQDEEIVIMPYDEKNAAWPLRASAWNSWRDLRVVSDLPPACC